MLLIDVYIFEMVWTIPRNFANYTLGKTIALGLNIEDETLRVFKEEKLGSRMDTSITRPKN